MSVAIQGPIEQKDRKAEGSQLGIKKQNCITKSRRKQEENRKWKHRTTKGSRKQAGKESRK